MADEMASSVHPHLLNLATNEVIQIRTEKILVGRSLKADYVISGPAVSRIHFSIEKNNGVWTMLDHSTNGTCVNNTVVKSRSKPLKSGDIIRFIDGSISLRFEIPLEPTSTTDSESNPDFIVSVTSGDDVPSVSNDHSYEGSEEPRTESDEIVESTSEGSPSTSGLSRAVKRSLSSVEEEIPSKKNKLLDESTDQSKIQCVLESSEMECSICQELFIKAVTLNCSHSFCSSCIYRWKSQRNHCPICRRPIENINPSMILDNIVKKLVVLMDDQAREQRDNLIKERPADVTFAAPPATLETVTEITDSDDFDEEEEDVDEDEYDEEDLEDFEEDDYEEEIIWDAWGEFYPEILDHHQFY